jgi:hypothetical protein
MEFDSLVIEDVFPKEEFEALKQYLRACKYKPLDKKNDFLYYSELPKQAIDKLINKVNEVTQMNLKEIVTFARLNTSVIDARVRIHADNIVFGKQPKFAFVYYLETNSESGTALLSSPTYGKERLDMKMSVFTEIGDWEVTKFNPELENSLFLYRSVLYHSRWPPISRGIDEKDGRIIIVSFLED